MARNCCAILLHMTSKNIKLSKTVLLKILLERFSQNHISNKINLLKDSDKMIFDPNLKGCEIIEIFEGILG
jgi:hypothetical protein